MTEKLTLGLVSKSHEKFSNIKTAQIQLNIDDKIKSFEVDIYKIFSPVAVKECVVEYIMNLDKIRKKNNNDVGDISEPYLMWLMIKHFTILGEEMPENYLEQLNSLKQMINTSALFQIMSNFDENEVSKIKDELEIIMATAEVNSDYIKELKKEFEEKISDKDLLK